MESEMRAVEGWEKYKVRDICDLGRGRVISGQEIERKPGVFPVYSSQSSNNGMMGAIDTFDFDGEYVTWTTDGAYAGTVFYRCGQFNCTNVCGTLRAKDSQVSMPFLAYKLSTVAKDYVSYVGNPKLMNGVMANIEFSIPASKPEQTKIAEILSTVDRAIEQTEALIAKQQRIKAGLMQDLLTRGIDEHGNLRSEQTHQFKDSPLGRIPVEWEVGGFDNYVVKAAGIKPGPFGSSLTKDMYVESGYRVYGQEQVIGGSLDLGNYFIPERKFKEMEGFAVRAGDVLISLVGTIGHVLIIPKGYHLGVINPRLLRFRPDPMRSLPEFLRAVLLSQPIRLQLDTFATGGTMPVLSAGIIRKLSVVMVDVNEQARIIQTIGKSEECLLTSSERLNKLRSLKTALMQDLLTGKRRVMALLNEKDIDSLRSEV